MRYIKKKIFWNSTDNKKEISAIKWNEDEMEYYSFIKLYIDEGFHQVVINLEMMLGLISLCANNINWSIVQIEMMETDDELDQELSSLIEAARNNRGAYLSLVETMRNLLEENSIEIKRIYLQEKRDKQYETCFIQVNGLLGVSSENTDIEKNTINYIREYMNV